MKKVLLTLVVLTVVFGAIFGYKLHQVRQAQATLAGRRPAPAVVTTAPAVADRWVTQLSAVADLESFRGITVAAEIEGRITRVAFESGETVEAGQRLVELDRSTEEAQLAALEADARLAQLTLERQRGLREQGTNAQAELDQAEAAAARAEAAVAEMKTILAKKRIVAPFAGRLGIREVDPGEFISKGDPVVTLEAIDPIYADFGLPQQEVERVKPGLPVSLRLDAFPERRFEGEVEAINPRISSATRNLAVRAVIPNPEHLLRPGMFGEVTVALADAREVLVVPATAIVYSPYGNSVYVIQAGADGGEVVEQRFVEVGPSRGDQVALLSGVQPGEQVVTAGQIKLRNGAPVRIDNSVTPSNDPTPTPAES